MTFLSSLYQSLRARHRLVSIGALFLAVPFLVYVSLRLPSTIWAIVVISVIASLAIYLTRPSHVYLLEYACHHPHTHPISHSEFIRMCQDSGRFSHRALDFQHSLLPRMGLGNNTYLASAVFNPSVESARDEAMHCISPCLESLFASMKSSGRALTPQDIDVLVVNCGLFTKASLADMIVNKYKMRSDTMALDLPGGGSGGILSLDLVRDMLRARKASYAVVVLAENTTTPFYTGDVDEMLVSNLIYRQGCAAILLTNKDCEKHRARYRLEHIARTHLGASDKAYYAMYQTDDPEGHVGLRLGRDLLGTSGEAIRQNLLFLGPRILTTARQLKFRAKRFLHHNLGIGPAPSIPKFKRFVDIFCIHPSGCGFLDAVQLSLGLSNEEMDASRAMLYRYGDTSSSSTWYELAYMERRGRVAPGHRVWQTSFGTGFQCRSVTWIALRGAQRPRTDDCWPELRELRFTQAPKPSDEEIRIEVADIDITPDSVARRASAIGPRPRRPSVLYSPPPRLPSPQRFAPVYPYAMDPDMN
eukprot:gnl/Trimastix_PCT/1834.p1 GENE.gnl/Trimastix_PCT/1834~~gnl/Trimastix_PCT/1834.p1  ORF type:complete len:530 (-),score=51.28 gnl/Trimastix_PCT/1834:51-1640(-)